MAEPITGLKVTPAAGGIIWRKAKGKSKGKGSKGVEVLVVHRPRYDDWTFPKGKAEPGEHPPVTAVREILEESDLRVRLGHPLPTVRYRIRGGLKQVLYWSARVRGKVPDFKSNSEVDKVRWLSPRDARKRLTYDHDKALLERFEDLADRKLHRTRTLVVLRHAEAQPRETYTGSDLDRPLTDFGAVQAKELVAVLEAYGVRRIVSSPATRCLATVDPLARNLDVPVELDDRLTEDASTAAVRRAIVKVLQTKKPVVICTHRPTLPSVFQSLNIKQTELAPGQAVVVHHRKGKVHSVEVI